MSAFQPFDRTMTTWFAEEDPRRAPEGLLGTVLAITSQQRPARTWVARLRVDPWGQSPGRARRLVALAATAALLAAMAGSVLYFGSRIQEHRTLVIAPSPSAPASPMVTAPLATASPTASTRASTVAIEMPPSEAPVGTVAPVSTAEPSVPPASSASPSPSAPPSALRGPHLLAFSPAEDCCVDESYVWLAERDGTNAREVSSGLFGSWSPTGHYLLAYRGRGFDVLDLAGRTVGHFPIGDAAWAPRDDELLDVVQPDPEGAKPIVALYRPDGSLIRRLQVPGGVTGLYSPTWSPDGSAFVVVGCEDCPSAHAPGRVADRQELWIVQADGGSWTPIAGTPTGSGIIPVWISGDSTEAHIVYSMDCSVTCSDTLGDVWLMVAGHRGTPQRILSDVQDTALIPGDDRLLYTKVVPEGGSRIFTSRTDGLEQRQLSDQQGADSHPVVVSGRNAVAYLHQDPNSQAKQVVVAPIDTGDAAASGGAQPDVIGVDWDAFGWQP
jgi:hypothetical protein